MSVAKFYPIPRVYPDCQASDLREHSCLSVTTFAS